MQPKREIPMSADVQKMKEHIAALKKGLFMIGRNRIAAQPAHTTWEITDDMEARAAELMKEIEKLEK